MTTAFCLCRYSRTDLLAEKQRRVSAGSHAAAAAAAAASCATAPPVGVIDEYLVHRVAAGVWVCSECQHAIGCHGSGSTAATDVCSYFAPAADETAAPSESKPISLVELQKPTRISRVILFACRKPRDVFRFAMVGRFWLECLVDFKLGKTVLGRMLDVSPGSNNAEIQTEADVREVWMQTTGILKQRGSWLSDSFNPDLVRELSLAVKEESLRAAAETLRLTKAAAAGGGSDGAAVPSRHRHISLLGMLSVAFSRCRPINWFASDRSSPTQHATEFSFTRPPPPQGANTPTAWSQFNCHKQESLHAVALEYMPPITWLSFGGTLFVHSPSQPFSSLAATSGQLLVELHLYQCDLSCSFSCADLGKLQVLAVCDLQYNDLRNNGRGLDLSELPASMRELYLYANASIKGDMRGKAPAAMRLLRIGETGLNPTPVDADQPTGFRIDATKY
jgi:hypothetical protein